MQCYNLRFTVSELPGVTLTLAFDASVNVISRRAEGLKEGMTVIEHAVSNRVDV